MRLPTLHVFLWLLPALTTSTREMVRLQPNPSVSAVCGQRVTLNCDLASSLDKVSIKHMEWSLNQRPLCSVDAHEDVTTHSGGGIKHFYCEYARGRLSLVLHEVRPADAINSDFMCKLKSNRGAKHINTRVELQECCGEVQTKMTSGASTCIFSHVHEGEDVHWFHGHHNRERLRENLETSRHMDGDGWWTITSTLQRTSSHTPFTCSLVSKSGRYLSSALVQTPHATAPWTRNAGSLLASTWSLLCVSIYWLLW